MKIDKLENNILLIIPNEIKEKMLIEINSSSKLVNIKIMSLDELKKHYYFDYTTESIFFIMKNYNYNYDFCCDIMDNIYYLKENNYPDEKLKLLVQIKQDLITNELLIFDPLFKNNIKNKIVYVYGFDYINNFYKEILNDINANIIEQVQHNYNHDVYEFTDIEQETKFVANKICEHITKKTPLNNIKIITPNSEYIPVIKRIFKQYNIPININNNYLISLKISNDFLNLLDDDITKTLDKLKDIIDETDDMALAEYNQIIKICNKYNWCNNFKEIKELLISELKNTKIDLPKINEAVNFVPLEDNIFDDDIVFLMGFNQSNYPKFYKDDNFINDKLKKLVNLETTTQKNENSYKILVNKLKNIKNLYISYKLNTPFNLCYKSQIIDDLNLNIIKYTQTNIHYSSLNDKLELANALDNYLKYGIKEQNLNMLINTYKNIEYKNYNNQYSIIDENIFRKYLKNKLSLSYSSINNFYHCSFRYYVENILKLQITDNKFNLFIGTLFHYILSIMYNDNFNFDKSFDNYVIENYNKSSFTEKFFIKKLKKELSFIIDVIKEQDKYTNFNQYLFEQEIKIDLSKDNYNITFKGIIDKIMYKQDSQTLIAIIDYKTGNPELNLNNVIYGLDMQLCIYAYLCSKMKIFANPILVGIYLQKILSNSINIEKGKSFNTIKKENLKLQGYSCDNEAILKQFDTTYTDSKIVKGLKIGSNGFYAYSKIFNQAILNFLLNITDINIKKARDQIINREFFINPKKIGIKNLVGCEYCKYSELCFMTEDNIINLKEYKKLEFLEDDNYELN